MGYKVRGEQGQGSMGSRAVGPLYSTADRPSTRPHASSPSWTEYRPSTAAHPPGPMVFAAALRVAIRPAARHAPAAAVERVRAEAGPGHDRRAGLHVLPRSVQGLRRLRVVRRAQAQVRRAVTLHDSAAGPELGLIAWAPLTLLWTDWKTPCFRPAPSSCVIIDFRLPCSTRLPACAKA